MVGVGLTIVEPGPCMQYLAGVRWGRSERPFLMVLPAEGEPVWIVPAFEQRTAREQLGPDATILAWHEHEDPFPRVAEAARLRGVEGQPACIDAQMRRFLGQSIERVLDDSPVFASAAVLDWVRMRKDARELERLRRANEATKRAIATAAVHVRPGIRQSEAAALIRGAQEAAGLRDVWVLALFGPAASFPHGTREDRVLEDDDVILVDTGGSLHGYRSDITRTWTVGRPDADVRRAFDTVAAAQAAALAEIRPGVSCGRPDEAARRVMADAGYGEAYEHFTHRLGHGIGLEVHEPPYLVSGSELVLQPGMTMSNEPGLYLPDRFGVRIEDIVVVTQTGAEVFGPPSGPCEAPLEAH